jgi:hypothetical protein
MVSFYNSLGLLPILLLALTRTPATLFVNSTPNTFFHVMSLAPINICIEDIHHVSAQCIKKDAICDAEGESVEVSMTATTHDRAAEGHAKEDADQPPPVKNTRVIAVDFVGI